MLSAQSRLALKHWTTESNARCDVSSLITSLRAFARIGTYASVNVALWAGARLSFNSSLTMPFLEDQHWLQPNGRLPTGAEDDTMASHVSQNVSGSHSIKGYVSAIRYALA